MTQGTIAVSDAFGAPGVLEEVDIRLRTTIKAHSITGYEVNASVSTYPSNFYITVVRWNGPVALERIRGLPRQVAVQAACDG